MSDHVRLEFKVPRAWVNMADQLAMMTGVSRAAYIRDALIRQMMEDWSIAPGRGFWLRPNAPVYRQTDRGTYEQIATTLGGERCWPIENMGYLPASLGGSIAFRADIMPVGTKQGLTMSDAIVARDSMGGPA